MNIITSLDIYILNTMQFKKKCIALLNQSMQCVHAMEFCTPGFIKIVYKQLKHPFIDEDKKQSKQLVKSL